MHRPLDLQSLTSKSIIDEALEHDPNSVREIRTHLGNVAHVVAASNVLYLPEPGLQIVDDSVVPAEGIVDPWNLTYCQRVALMPFGRPSFPTNYLDEEVCCLSNVFSKNFSHFHEELLKVVILERAGFTGSYVYTHLPDFAFEFWDALSLDRRRLKQISLDPVVFRSALYTTHLNFNFMGLQKCPDIFFELRDRMFRAATGLASPFGQRLWLDRGSKATGTDRDLVNPEEVSSCLTQYGVTRLDIGSLPVPQQIAAVRDADVIAGPHGSAFLHCMYLKPQSTVIEVFSPNFLNGFSFEICRVLDHRYVMIAGNNSPKEPYPFGMQVHVPCDQLRLALSSVS